MSLKTNVAYNTVLNVLNVAFPVITTPYVSRVLGVENIGIVNFATTYASYFALFATLGIPIYGIREIAKCNNNLKERQQVFSELFAISCLSTVICSLIYLVSVFTVPSLHNDREFLLIAGIAVFFVPLHIDWFFSGREKFKIITVRSIIVKVIFFAGLFIFVHSHNDVIIYMILCVMANLLSQFWTFSYMLKTELKPRFKNLNLQKHIKAVLTLFVSNIAISIYTMLSPLLLGFMSDYTQVGYYTSAIKISKLILPIITAMSLVMIARINTLKSEANNTAEISKLLNNSLEYMLMLAIPATIGLFMITPRFVPLFFGTEFIPMTSSMQLLTLLIIIIGISNLFGIQILVAMGHERKFLTAVLMGTFSSLLLNLVLIRQYGSMGASVASVIAEIFVTVATIIFAFKILPIKINIKSLYQPLLASLFIIGTAMVFNRLIERNFVYITATIITGIMLYIIVMVFVFRHKQANSILTSITEKIKYIFTSKNV
jgi:O-antigen/teichoic acid export membrane protein